MAAGTGFNAKWKEIPLSEIPSHIIDNDLPNAAGTTYVERKEDMTYEELCTLEGMIALFNHDTSLDKEIANLKEEALLKTIHDLESKYNTLEAEYTSMLFNTDNKKASERMMDALMLMSHIKPEDIPAGVEFIERVADDPSILLNYIPEDESITWPVSVVNNGKAVRINHGLNTDMEDA